ncbi:MAG: exo-alpha-sialidase [Burkholderiales bacterium]|nr:exo-alpha-sialidase [Opitutaceae bacterium]
MKLYPFIRVSAVFVIGLLFAGLAQASSTFPAASQPQLAVTNEGRVYLVYGSNKSVYVARSVDGGASFDKPVKVTTAPSLAIGMRRGPRIAAQGDHVTVTLNAGELLAFSSPDGGRTWTGPVTINDVPGSSREGLHDLAVTPNGRLFLTWLDLREGTTALFASESSDGGQTWTRNAPLYRSPETSICECCHPSAVFDSAGNLAVMWRNWLGGSRDLWLMIRQAGSERFSEPVKQGAGTWKLNGCPMDGGDVFANTRGNFDTVWQRAGSIFIQSPNQPELRLAAGQQPVAAIVGDHTLIAWQKGADIWSVQLSSGNPVSEPAVLAVGARYPALVALSRSKAILAYEQGSDVIVETP